MKKQKDNIHNLDTMSDGELLRYYDGIRSTTSHLQELVSKSKLPTYIDWQRAFSERKTHIEKVKTEILKRMERRKKNAKEKKD